MTVIIADHALGLPVFRALSLCTCRRHYPGAASGRIASLISSRRISLPRKGCRVGLRIVLFEACSAFTRVAACTLALSPIRDTLIEGFSHFVTSMTAPIASGWSGCRMGLAPTGKRRLVTAHTRSGHLRRSVRGAKHLPLLANTLQRMGAEIIELNTGASNEILHGTRDEHVVGAANMRHARSDVHGDPAHVVLSQL